MSVIQFKPYFDRRRQTGDMDPRVSRPLAFFADRSVESTTSPNVTTGTLERQIRGRIVVEMDAYGFETAQVEGIYALSSRDFMRMIGRLLTKALNLKH
ncbi:hypothetical protein [Paraburkholderia youngii]|uniref:hypothetical protein n=1 Tax=Paraburkholderia youngii TaxID=2782701 RepID=UPI0015918E86|nr:hypothetical protein [Paraburkholderia youngii]NUX55953.1 hypothetical protein [Paraburkholderia youngii]